MTDSSDSYAYTEWLIETYPQAAHIEVDAFVNAFTKAELLHYGFKQTIEMALSLCGVPNLRKPNRAERRTMGIR